MEGNARLQNVVGAPTLNEYGIEKPQILRMNLRDLGEGWPNKA